MQLVYAVVLFLGVSIAMTYASPVSDFIERAEAMEFLQEEERELEALDQSKRFLYTGKEQRREVKERYEEKCERNVIQKQRSKPRWCPPLESWPAWQQMAAKDGTTTKKPGKIFG